MALSAEGEARGFNFVRGDKSGCLRLSSSGIVGSRSTTGRTRGIGGGELKNGISGVRLSLLEDTGGGGLLGDGGVSDSRSLAERSGGLPGVLAVCGDVVTGEVAVRLVQDEKYGLAPGALAALEALAAPFALGGDDAVDPHSEGQDVHPEADGVLNSGVPGVFPAWWVSRWRGAIMQASALKEVDCKCTHR